MEGREDDVIDAKHFRKVFRLSNRIQRGSSLMSDGKPVIADLDLLFSFGCTEVQLKEHGFITTFNQLIETIVVRSQNGEQQCVYRLGKKAEEIRDRWEAGQLYNSGLKEVWDEKIIKRMVACWKNNGTFDFEKKEGVVGALNKQFDELVECATFDFLEGKLFDGKVQNQISETIIGKIYDDYVQGNIQNKEMENKIKDGRSTTFLRKMKEGEFSSKENVLFESVIKDYWLSAVRKGYKHAVPSLDSYCWKLALEEAGNTCRYSMETFLEGAIIKVLSTWRSNKEPANSGRLFEHFEKFLRRLYDEYILRNSEFDDKMTLLVVGEVIEEEKADVSEGYYLKICMNVMKEYLQGMLVNRESNDLDLCISIDEIITTSAYNLLCDYKAGDLTLELCGKIRAVIESTLPTQLNFKGSASLLKSYGQFKGNGKEEGVELVDTNDKSQKSDVTLK